MISFTKSCQYLRPHWHPVPDIKSCAEMSEGVRRILVRTAMALGCLGTACYVPFLALVMSLIGSLLTIGTAIILPVAIHSKIFKVNSFLF